MKKDKQHNFSGMDEGLLEEFESELAEEEKSRKTRVTVVMIGLTAGILVGLYLALLGGNLGDNELIPDIEVSQSETEAEARPVEVPRPVEVVKVLNSQEEEALKPSKSGEPTEAEFTAPDILVTENPMKASLEAEEKNFSFEALPEDEDFDNPLRDIHKDVDSKKGEKKNAEKKTASITIGGGETKPAAKPVAKPAKKVLAPSADKYAVRISATTDAVESLKVRDKLKKQGYKAWISQGKVRQNIFRVVAGEFRSIKEASALSAKLAQSGFSPRTSYIQKGSKVTLVVGAYQTSQRAKQVVELMEKKGYGATIKRSGGAMDLYVVLVGRYNSVAEAKRMEKRISGSGQRTLGIAKAN